MVLDFVFCLMVVIQVMLMAWIQLNFPLVDQEPLLDLILRKEVNQLVSVQIPMVG